MDDFTNTVRQNQVALPLSFFPDPYQTASEIDIFDIQSNQRRGSKTQRAQQHDDHKVSQTQKVFRLTTKIVDKPIVFIDCEKLRYGFFDFRIREFESDVFGHVPVKRQKVKKLSERPDA